MASGPRPSARQRWRGEGGVWDVPGNGERDGGEGSPDDGRWRGAATVGLRPSAAPPRWRRGAGVTAPVGSSAVASRGRGEGSGVPSAVASRGSGVLRCALVCSGGNG